MVVRVYCVVGENGWIYIANKDGSCGIWGCSMVCGSEIVEKAVLDSQNLPQVTVGMNMTYDGWIVATENGYLVAISSDLKKYHMIRLLCR